MTARILICECANEAPAASSASVSTRVTQSACGWVSGRDIFAVQPRRGHEGRCVIGFVRVAVEEVHAEMWMLNDGRNELVQLSASRDGSHDALRGVAGGVEAMEASA